MRRGEALRGRQPGQSRPVAVDEANAAMRPPFGVDRDPRLGERLHVAVDRPDGDLELRGELRGGHPAPRLEQQEDVDETAGSHQRRILLMTGIVSNRGDESRHRGRLT